MLHEGKISILGNHDEGTLSQIRRAASANECVRAALMADGHRGAGIDESPDCYKRLPEVLREQGSGIKILHTLTPIGVAMAGKEIHDPYKD